MTTEEIKNAVQNILLDHFNILPQQFDWEKPLKAMDKDFEILSQLMYLEQLLSKHYNKKIPMIENISTDFHSPLDICNLILREFNHVQK